MHALAQVINQTKAPAPSRWERRKYRHTAVFVQDELAHGVPMDRNTRAKLLYLAKQLDRRTKSPRTAQRRARCHRARGAARASPALCQWAHGPLLSVVHGPSGLYWSMSPGDRRRAGAARSNGHRQDRAPHRAGDDHSDFCHHRAERAHCDDGPAIEPLRVLGARRACTAPAVAASECSVVPSPRPVSGCFSTSSEPSLPGRQKTNPLVISNVETPHKSIPQ